MNLFGKYDAKSGFSALAMPGKMGLKLIEFGILRLEDGETFSEDTGEREAVLVILSGRCDITSAAQAWHSVGERESVFQGLPHSVYLPPRSNYTVVGCGRVEIAACRAPARSGREARLIVPGDVTVLSRGRENWYRDVYEIAHLGEEAESLIVGETLSGPGNWCSFPPHEHDLEELYFFKVNPPQGFGFQRVYTHDRKLDELYTVENDSLVAIPRGFHPLVAAPGYSVWFLYLLAAKEGQVLEPRNDPAHNWLNNQRTHES